ncbi:uncharacterized protein RHOBADRAFT_47407 [Rhodotorula graminis WP1]|uniref:Uncharacterized protein n=1 Tax=Rhodotorula graminis (strain WP1) TaxID=578459 RepID=A0A0N8PZC7_RHOGW|nr:uncharacterized protein RHOBADRAFT_47407 [Rhodotorula graminis WP1]KPV71957.1 hypothetical protein RHOBADRAFT_47407 [Rhodotorula graminis WP1]
MAGALSGSWNAFQCANLGYGQILRPLQREVPGSVLVLDGLAALGIASKLIERHRTQEEKDRHIYLLSISKELEFLQVPTKLFPIVIHMPSSMSRTEALDEQRQFKDSVDGECTSALQQPFKRLSLKHGALPHLNVGPTLDVACHLRYVQNPFHSSLVASYTDPTGSAFLYATWPLVAVQALILGADTDNAKGICAALTLVRWAVSLGRDEIDSARVFAAAGRPHARPAFSSVTEALRQAVYGTLLSEEGDAAMDVWLARFENNVAVEAAMFEWDANGQARAHFRQEALLHAQYTQLCGALKDLLTGAHDHYAHMPRHHHSLAKREFEPAARRAFGRRNVFV